MDNFEYFFGETLSEQYFKVFEPSNLGKSTFIYPMRSAICQSSLDYCISRSTYHCPYLLIEVHTGALAVLTHAGYFEVYPKQAVLIETRRPHIYCSMGDHNLDISWLCFDGINSKQYFDYLVITNESHVFDVDSEFTLKYQNFISDLSTKYLPEITVSKLLYDLLEALINHNRYYSPIDDVIHYIQKNYREKILIENLCEMCYLSPPHFHVIFKKKTGFSPHQYIIRTRLLMAQHSIIYTSKTIEDIAMTEGFPNTSLFIKSFVKMFGVTPGKMRSNLKFRSY